MIELWKTISDSPDYAVSNIGRVKRIVDNSWSMAGKILKPEKDKDGYLRITLYNNSNRKKFNIHRLVLIAFKGKSDLQCNHINGNKSDNCIENLEWVTQSENILHAYGTGLIKKHRGEKCPTAKLTNDKVLIIRAMYPIYLQSEIADMFNISKQQTSRIIRRERWAHI